MRRQLGQQSSRAFPVQNSEPALLDRKHRDVWNTGYALSSVGVVQDGRQNGKVFVGGSSRDIALGAQPITEISQLRSGQLISVGRVALGTSCNA
jgi:hypothetical protein